jgi:hypothetical protein
MNNFALFIPMTKADAALRLVYGSIDETPDHAREIMDYATAKPAFQEWSDNMAKASGGKSLGNIRAQHDMKKAAGRLTDIGFDDETKSISFVAHIVDDQEWAKVEAGVYTGFSPGGSYAKRWKDGAIADHHRYTPRVGELSIVDAPCIPSGTFTMVKADGAEERVEFVLGKAYEPGNELTKARAEDMAKAAAGTTFKDHIIQARADLIAENAAEALTKMAETPEPEAPVADPVVEAAPDRLAVLDAALAKADDVLVVPEIAADPVASPTELADGLTELAKAHEGEVLLAKGLTGITRLASAIYQVVAVQATCARECEEEGDSSPVPAQIAAGIQTLCDALCAMAMEETAELMDDMSDVGMVPDAYDYGDFMAAAKIVDLAKADTVLMEKAGARNSRTDATRIQTIHDRSCELGAACADGGAAEKAVGLADENERLAKAVDSALPRLEKLTEEIGSLRAERDADRAAMVKMQGDLAAVSAQPAPTKVQLAIAKQEETSGLAKTDEPITGTIAAILAMEAGPERLRALEAFAANARTAS